MAVNDKIFLIGGCSYTAQDDPKRYSWARQFAESMRVGGTVINTAQMASGNQIIFDRLACELSRQEVLDNNPVVLVMWSSPLRKEFLLDSENADWRQVYRDRHKGFSNYIRTRVEGGDMSELKHAMSNWLLVGGGYGVWDYGIASLDARIKSYFDGVYSIPQCYVDTCRAIVGLQTLCKSLDVPLVNMCWMNIFHDLHAWEGYDHNKTSINATAGWLGRRLWHNFTGTEYQLPDSMESEYINKAIEKKYPDCKHWVDMIDWDTWLFYENDKVRKGGLGEFSYFECETEAKDMWEHPTTEVQKNWMKYVKDNLKERGLL